MTVSTIQDELVRYFEWLADRINKNQRLLADFQQDMLGGRSILIVLSDQEAACGLLVDSLGGIRITNPTAVNPTLKVFSPYSVFRDVMTGKLDVEYAFAMDRFQLEGAHGLSDYLVIKDFFKRLIAVAS